MTIGSCALRRRSLFYSTWLLLLLCCRRFRLIVRFLIVRGGRRRASGRLPNREPMLLLRDLAHLTALGGWRATPSIGVIVIHFICRLCYADVYGTGDFLL